MDITALFAIAILGALHGVISPYKPLFTDMFSDMLQLIAGGTFSANPHCDYTQWGVVDVSSIATFPITFKTTVFQVATIPKNSNINANAIGCDVLVPRNVTIKSFQAGSINYQWNQMVMNYIAIGLQQWGYNSEVNIPTALTFPVSFTSNVYALTIGNVGLNQYNANTSVYDITTKGCTIAFNARAYWVVIGVQRSGEIVM